MTGSRGVTYLSTDTICALASPPGGAICVLRISGPETFAALSRLSGVSVREVHPPRELFRASLRDMRGNRLDDAMAVYFVAPKSFTGEDSAEVYLHGSPFVAAEAIETLSHWGVRQALAGEFSFRAVRNGKMDLSQARAVSDLVSASNRAAVGLALEKLEGSQSRLVMAIAEELRTLSALGELGIDFADQDVDEVSLGRLQERVRTLDAELAKLEAGFERGSKIQDGIRAAFVGLPNAGKSSFFNALLGEERSIVSEIAGTTRDVVGERLTLRHVGREGDRSVTFRLEDTAGLRSGQDPIEKIGIERTVRAASEAEVVVLLVDASQSVESFSEIRTIWERIGAPAKKTIGVLTKCDLASTDRQAIWTDTLQTGLGVRGWIPTSARDASGLRQATEALVDHGARLLHREPGEVLLTRLDELHAVRGTREALARAIRAQDEALFAADLRQGLLALGPVIGTTLPDDILGRIFSRFCIGK